VHAGDNALGHGEGQLTQGVADGKDLIPHLEVSGAAEGDRGQGVLAGIDLQHGQIVVLVSADDFSGVGAAVVEGDFHIRARRAETFADHVVVGDDVAVIRDNEAAAGAGGLDHLSKKVVIGGDVDAHAAVDV